MQSYVVGALLGAACLFGCPSAPVPDESSPAGGEASLETVVRFPNVAIAFQVASDGRVFFTERDTGKVRVLRDGRILDAPDLTLGVNSAGGERGLLGLALHPAFDENAKLYVYYSRSASGAVVRDRDQSEDIAGIRVSQLQVDGDVVVGPEVTIADFPVDDPSNLSHFGGNIHFGADGKLYVARGDLRVPENAQDLDRTEGKILRYNDDGSIPADNPFGPDNPVWALGLRNTFEFAFDPVEGAIFGAESGPADHDELNRLIAGGNYQWPRFSGLAEVLPDVDLTFGESMPPLIDLAPEPPAVTPTAVGFLPNDRYGAGTTNDLLLGEFSTRRIWRIELDEARDTVVEQTLFADLSTIEAAGPIDLFFDADGVLYVSTGFQLLRAVPIP